MPSSQNDIGLFANTVTPRELPTRTFTVTNGVARKVVQKFRAYSSYAESFADYAQMMKNNPPDVVYNAFSQAFFQGMIRLFQKDNEMKSIVMTDKTAREQATRHFFRRAQRQAMG